jgi:hypothetical protein
LLAQEERRHDDPHAAESRGEAGGGVGGAKQPEHEGDQVELLRPVHHGVVRVAVADVEVARIDGVKALIVVYATVTDIPEAGKEGQCKDRKVDQGFVRDN